MNSQSIPEKEEKPIPAGAHAVWAYALRVMKEGRLFKGWTIGQIAYEIKKALEAGNFVWVTKPGTTEVQGFVLFRPDHVMKYIEVDAWIAETFDVLQLVSRHLHIASGYFAVHEVEQFVDS
jgi:hypothetical protein